MCARPLNLLVFRDAKRVISGSAARRNIIESLRRLPSSFHQNLMVEALLRAGELECAVADLGVPASELEKLTDAVADALVRGAAIADLSKLFAILEEVEIPERLAASVPEGFAYYALHPLAFADALEYLGELPPRVAVIGIRSIGTTLSAVTAAALRLRGIQVERVTVRPTGHPYNRRTEFTSEVAGFIKRQLSLPATFLVVDEGPGLSGSSFLSVAEALVLASVPRERITLICSHTPEIDRLCADDAPRRWRQFCSISVSAEPRRPAGARVWIGGGEWRRFLLPHQSAWPAAWLSFERLKYLPGDGCEPLFYKFLGLGHYGKEVMEREERVASAGFGPSPRSEDHGFVSFPYIDGRPMVMADLSQSVLARLAAYCAFRQRTFAVEAAGIDSLQKMAEHNLRQLGMEAPLNLRLERPTIADGRMQPHEWLLTRAGQMLKTDSGSHGDDHFFPGATDIAWDLAGAIVEWRMSDAQAKTLLEMYCRASGDDASLRIDDYITAYAVFRRAYCLMAANAMQGSEEAHRLNQAAEAMPEFAKSHH